MQSLTVAALMLRAIRPHYWLKNLLIFLPAMIADTLTPTSAATLLIATLAFSCAASANYVVNDLIDMKTDRANPAKRLRPIAAGEIGMRAIAVLLALLVAVGIAAAASLPAGFQMTLAIYFALCLLYSFWLKGFLIIDVMCLVVLYDLRLVAGAEALLLPQSLPLIAAGSLTFATLAFTKRVAQIARVSNNSDLCSSGLAYTRHNLSVVSILAGLGLAVSTVVSLYLLLSSAASRENLIVEIVTILALAFWSSRNLALAMRARLNEDMVLFILTDRFSIAMLVVVGGLWLLAAS